MSKQKHFYPKKYQKKQKIKSFFATVINCACLAFMLWCMLMIRDAKEERLIAQEVKKEAPIAFKEEKRETFDGMLKKYVIPTKQAKKIDKKQAACLAKNIFFEARGSDTREQILVAEVTLNRAEAHGFPPDVCGVVYQKLDAAAFSWTTEHHNFKWILRNSVERAAWHRSQFIAEKMLAGEIVRKHKNILFYHANWLKKPSSWQDVKVAFKTEDHTYYKYSGN